jgi:hypothetical protein
MVRLLKRRTVMSCEFFVRMSLHGVNFPVSAHQKPRLDGFGVKRVTIKKPALICLKGSRFFDTSDASVWPEEPTMQGRIVATRRVMARG